MKVAPPPDCSTLPFGPYTTCPLFTSKPAKSPNATVTKPYASAVMAVTGIGGSKEPDSVIAKSLFWTLTENILWFVPMNRNFEFAAIEADAVRPPVRGSETVLKRVTVTVSDVGVMTSVFL